MVDPQDNAGLSPSLAVADMSNRYQASQRDRTLNHPTLPQPSLLKSIDESQATTGGIVDISPENERHNVVKGEEEDFTFVVVADTQFGMTDRNISWQREVAYSQQAIRQINKMQPRPKFCCICGDLVDMTSNLYANRSIISWRHFRWRWTEADCDATQDAQYRDFQDTWQELHPSIALICVCGNHDIGNRPTMSSIQRFTKLFGDDYLAFWAPLKSYCIVLNTTVFHTPHEVSKYHEEQLAWLEKRLQYARGQEARTIFVFGHHPWFLQDPDEDERTSITSISPWPEEWGWRPWGFSGFPDRFAPIPLRHRQAVISLFQQYRVTACLAGHFHQNLVRTTNFGMEMITTSSLSLVMPSTPVLQTDRPEEPQTRGLRVVTVHAPTPVTSDNTDPALYTHRFFSLQES